MNITIYGCRTSRFLTDGAEAARGFALAERLGSISAAASQLGTTWPSLRKVALRHQAWGATSPSCGLESLPPDAALQQQP
jgi:hypothetical protein